MKLQSTSVSILTYPTFTLFERGTSNLYHRMPDTGMSTVAIEHALLGVNLPHTLHVELLAMRNTQDYYAALAS